MPWIFLKTNKLTRGIYLMTLLFASSLVYAANNWQGNYRYSAVIGHTQGIALSVEYHLSITANQCRLTAAGYQTNLDIICQVQAKGSAAAIDFIRFANGSTKNRYGVEVYQNHQTLFELSHKRGQLLTAWQALKPNQSSKEIGVFFEKSD